jgi:hypothetical protein
LVVPRGACAQLPADAYRAAIAAKVGGTVHATSDLQHVRVALDVTHSGAGAPWLGSHAITNDAGCGRVEVQVSVEDDNGQVVTQRTVPTPAGLFPGQSWHLHPRIVDAKTTAVLAPGHHFRLRVQLVQDGVRKFGGPDGDGVTVPLGAT